MADDSHKTPSPRSGASSGPSPQHAADTLAHEELGGESERRGSPRAPISLRVEYSKLNAFFADYTKNISHGGTFIRSDDPMPVGTVFMFRLVVPRLEAPIALRGEVVWLLRPGDTPPPGQPEEPGMGIRFLYDSPEQRAAITEPVEQLIIDSLGPHLYHRLTGRKRT